VHPFVEVRFLGVDVPVEVEIPLAAENASLLPETRGQELETSLPNPDQR
jgi:hypothetical protein